MSGAGLPQSVVFIDDEDDVRRANAQSLDLAGFGVQLFASAEAAGSAFGADFPGVVVTDVRLPGTDGLALLRRVVEIDADLPVILITGHGDIPMAVEAMREGAYDFIEKPYPADRLVESVRRAVEKRHLALENRALRAELARRDDGDVPLLGQAPAMVKLRRSLVDLAGLDVDVLVSGEAGSGKETAALLLHRWGPRRGKFVALNCSAMPEAGAESELFGHEPGAFAGAQRKRIGRVEQADGGTLFLDEVDALPTPFQVKLLRALQDRAIEPMGSDETKPVDVRVVAATKTDLAQAAARGEFREDLFYRFNVASLTIPPLRDRREDIPLLFEHFAGRAASRFGRETQAPTPEVMRFLLGHPWPGNVRELAHFAERYVLGLADEIGKPPKLSGAARATLAEQTDAFERGLIVRELAANKGDIKATTEALGLPRRTLYDKMTRFGIDLRVYR